MFRTIFRKLVISFTAILLIGFLITGVMLNFFLSSYALEEKTRLMEEEIEYLNSYMSENRDELNNIWFINNFMNYLKFLKKGESLYVWIIGKDGRVLITDDFFVELSIPRVILNKMENKQGYYFLPDKRQYARVMEGSTVKEQGYFYGLFEDTRVPWLIMQKPFEYNGEIIAAIYISTPIPEVQKAKSAVFRFFIFSVGISVLISILIVYIISHKITSPLKKINDAAKAISKGDFKSRIDIKSRDEIGQLARVFNRMTEDLQKLEEMRRDFIANVSHELRTPMTSVKGFVQGILDGTIPEEKRREYLEIVMDETTRLSRLVNDLLQLARMEAGDQVLELKEFDINELLRRSVIKLETMITRKNIQVEADFEYEKTIVVADPDAIERVVLNLIHNATKFTQEGGKITLGTGVKKDRAYVSVTDNGIGIDSEELGMIWQRFYKTDKSRVRENTGTGLGLAIIKSIIDRHEQDIWVESVKGMGTRFTFTLKLSSKN